MKFDDDTVLHRGQSNKAMSRPCALTNIGVYVNSPAIPWLPHVEHFHQDHPTTLNTEPSNLTSPLHLSSLPPLSHPIPSTNQCQPPSTPPSHHLQPLPALNQHPSPQQERQAPLPAPPQPCPSKPSCPLTTPPTRPPHSSPARVWTSC
jgi:hypothetical protein